MAVDKGGSGSKTVVVKKTDTPITLAQKTGVPPEVFLKSNGIVSLTPGQTVVVPAPVRTGATSLSPDAGQTTAQIMAARHQGIGAPNPNFAVPSPATNTNLNQQSAIGTFRGSVNPYPFVFTTTNAQNGAGNQMPTPATIWGQAGAGMTPTIPGQHIANILQQSYMSQTGVGGPVAGDKQGQLLSVLYGKNLSPDKQGGEFGKVPKNPSTVNYDLPEQALRAMGIGGDRWYSDAITQNYATLSPAFLASQELQAAIKDSQYTGTFDPSKLPSVISVDDLKKIQAESGNWSKGVLFDPQTLAALGGYYDPKDDSWHFPTSTNPRYTGNSDYDSNGQKVRKFNPDENAAGGGGSSATPGVNPEIPPPIYGTNNLVWRN